MIFKLLSIRHVSDPAFRTPFTLNPDASNSIPEASSPNISSLDSGTVITPNTYGTDFEINTFLLLGIVTSAPGEGTVSPFHVLSSSQFNNPCCKWGQSVLLPPSKKNWFDWIRNTNNLRSSFCSNITQGIAT